MLPAVNACTCSVAVHNMCVATSAASGLVLRITTLPIPHGSCTNAQHVEARTQGRARQPRALAGAHTGQAAEALPPPLTCAAGARAQRRASRRARRWRTRWPAWALTARCAARPSPRCPAAGR